jgi:hypothetical protein
MGYYKTLAKGQESKTMRDLTAKDQIHSRTRSQHYWTCGNCDEELDTMKAEELLDTIIETLRTQPVTASLQQQLLTDMSRVRQIVLCGGIDE